MIAEFKDEYSFLSNFYTSPFIVNGITFPTAEHYYQASKTTNPIQYWDIAHAKTPGEAKKLGKTCDLRVDREDIKLLVMEEAHKAKFSNRELYLKLKKTGTEELQEGNYWNDTYWGIDLKTGSGENNLGKLLMKIRNLTI